MSPLKKADKNPYILYVFAGYIIMLVLLQLVTFEDTLQSIMAYGFGKLLSTLGLLCVVGAEIWSLLFVLKLSKSRLSRKVSAFALVLWPTAWLLLIIYVLILGQPNAQIAILGGLAPLHLWIGMLLGVMQATMALYCLKVIKRGGTI